MVTYFFVCLILHTIDMVNVPKRPGRSRKRRLNRKSSRYSKYTKKVRTESCVKIQIMFREYLNRRYKNISPNYDDLDYITLEPVSMIPKGLVYVMDDVMFNAASLLVWISKTKKHPLTRASIPPSTICRCYDIVSKFIHSDNVTSIIRKGKYKKMNFCRKAVRSYELSNKQ